MTEHTAYNQWRMTLLDTIFKVSSGYKPGNLVSIGQANIAGSGKVRRLVIGDLAALADAARAAGNPLRVVSAHRSYGQQSTLYQREVQRYGVQQARLQVARPGHSEHQLGTTIDFGSAGTSVKPWSSDFAKTPAGSWLKKNGWKYGFVMSYPKGKKSLTCYKYEPWHWRYVGREMAANMHGTGLTLREYLWQQFH
jgi:D-alanyl-D-alanine carboxypeptidase